MKRKLLREFADWLARQRRPFNLSRCDHCVSAQAVRFKAAMEGRRAGYVYGSAAVLQNVFGLDYTEAQNIYCGIGVPTDKDRITRKVAVAMLRILARTGRVDWIGAIRSAKT